MQALKGGGEAAGNPSQGQQPLQNCMDAVAVHVFGILVSSNTWGGAGQLQGLQETAGQQHSYPQAPCTCSCSCKAAWKQLWCTAPCEGANFKHITIFLVNNRVREYECSPETRAPDGKLAWQ